MNDEKEENFLEIIENCVGPSIDSLFGQLMINFLVNLLFNLALRFGKLPYAMFHYLSMVCGIIVLSVGLLGWDIIIHLSLLFCGYTMLYYTFKLRNTRVGNSIDPTHITEIVCVVFLIYGEFYYRNVDLWLRCRGIAMIAVMKIISIAFDFRHSSGPSFAEYAGYLLCPANCMLGPWTTFDEYVKPYFLRSKLNYKWIRRILTTTGLAFIFLSVSNCFTDNYIPEEIEWIFAYKKALSFRTSHYFISYLSEAIMLIAGYNEKVDSDEWSYSITNPFYVELPRSLATVVIYWNMPMHRFLKMYIYIFYLPYSYALAIFFTYFFSALLHGLNIQIGLVLLSLGGFSYVQAVSQMITSKIFNACVKVRPCSNNCDHRFKMYHPLTLLINFLFMIFNVIHLAYLGAVMNIISTNRSVYDTLVKWELLGFSCHHLFFMVFCIWWLFKGVPT